MTAPPQIDGGAGLAVEWVGISQPRTRYDLFINAQEIDRCLRLMFDFGIERLDPAMMRQLGAHVIALLRQAIDDPTRHLDDYSLGASDGEPVPTAQPDSPVAPADWAVDRFGLTSADRFAVLSDVPGHLVSALRSSQAAGASLLTPEPSPRPMSAASRPGCRTTPSASCTSRRRCCVRWPRRPRPRASTHCVACSSTTRASSSVRTSTRCARCRRRADASRCTASAWTVVRCAVYAVPDDWQAATAPLRVPLGVELPDRPRARTAPRRAARRGRRGRRALVRPAADR